MALNEDQSNDNSKHSKMIADRKRENEITEKAITKTAALMKMFAVLSLKYDLVCIQRDKNQSFGTMRENIGKQSFKSCEQPPEEEQGLGKQNLEEIGLRIQVRLQ